MSFLELYSCAIFRHRDACEWLSFSFNLSCQHHFVQRHHLKVGIKYQVLAVKTGKPGNWPKGAFGRKLHSQAHGSKEHDMLLNQQQRFLHAFLFMI